MIMGVSRTLRLAALVALVATAWGCDEPSPKPHPPPRKSAAPAAPSASASAAALDGVDTTILASAREREQWSELVGETMAPCKDVAVSLRQCVAEKRACRACKPAILLIARLVHAAVPKEDILSVLEDRFNADKVHAIVIGDSPVRGPSDAPVTLIEFADFECPACGAAYPMLEEAYSKFKGNIRFVFKNFPLSAHPNARIAAQAGYAALQQHKFWEMHHVLFPNQERLSEPQLSEYARGLHLDMAVFAKDMASEAAKQRIADETKQGDDLGVDSTPTIYINGRHCDLTKLGSEPDVELERWIQLEIELSGKDPAPASSAAAAASSSAKAPAPKGSGPR